MKIIAIAIARQVSDPLKAETDLGHVDKQGHFLYVDCLWCANTNALGLMAIALSNQYGAKITPSWHRWRGSLKVRTAKAEKLLTRLLNVHPS